MDSRIPENQTAGTLSEQEVGDGSHATSSGGQSVIEVEEEVKWFPIFLGIVRDTIEEEKMAQNFEGHSRPLMVTADPHLREKLGRERLEPKHMSFGPLHYGNDGLRNGETFKRNCAFRYICTIGEEDYFNICSCIMKEVHSLRQCYYRRDGNEWSRFCDKYRNENKDIFSQFPETLSPSHYDYIISWMFLVDGLALLHLIDHFLFGSYLSTNGFYSDVFLLENQLPSKLLVMLMELPSLMGDPVMLMELPSRMGDLVPVFVQAYCHQLWRVFPDGSSNVHLADSSHLLHLLWLMMSEMFEGPRKGHPWENQQGPSHNIQELKEVGIELKPMGSTKQGHPVFKMGHLFARLELPKFAIEDETVTILSNLIAFEMDPHFDCDLEVASYIGFLNSLVANPLDIAELRSAGIIHNNLRNDEAAFELLRRLDVGIPRKRNASSLCQADIHKYLEQHKTRTKIATWLVDAVRVYFKSPWTTIAVLAATVALILTAIQTYFAIFPRKH